jgi:DNA repair protein RecO (recombination protein O)
MIAKTRGIVLSFIKYGDSSIITKIYTEKYGLQSYIVNSVRSKSSKNKISLFQPMSLLDLVVYHKETAGLQRMSEIKCNYQYATLHTEHVKVLVCFFIQEFLSKTLRHENANTPLFEFINSSLKIYDTLDKNHQNFHLQFILKISDHLGFSIASTKEFFEHINKVYAPKNESILIDRLINENYGSEIGLNVQQRREILKDCLKYYSLNYEGITELKSLDIIRDIME